MSAHLRLEQHCEEQGLIDALLLTLLTSYSLPLPLPPTPSPPSTHSLSPFLPSSSFHSPLHPSLPPYLPPFPLLHLFPTPASPPSLCYSSTTIPLLLRYSTATPLLLFCYFPHFTWHSALYSWSHSSSGLYAAILAAYFIATFTAHSLNISYYLFHRPMLVIVHTVFLDRACVLYSALLYYIHIFALRASLTFFLALWLAVSRHLGNAHLDNGNPHSSLYTALA